MLVAIAHHAQPDRLPYLRLILNVFSEYELSMEIIIDTNATALDVRGQNITVVSHVSLEHDFYLCWLHRRHFKERIDDYKYFLYCENDLAIPFAHFQNYQRNFELLWPGAVPQFLRVEQFNGKQWALDVTKPQKREPIPIGDRTFARLNEAYHGCWCLPQAALKGNMIPGFARLSDSRETAASYVIWELNKTALIQIEGNKIVKEAFAYHLPNNYSMCPTSPFAKIKVEDVLL